MWGRPPDRTRSDSTLAYFGPSKVIKKSPTLVQKAFPPKKLDNQGLLITVQKLKVLDCCRREEID